MVDATGYTGNRHYDQAFGKFPPIYRPDEPNPHECAVPGPNPTWGGKWDSLVTRGRERERERERERHFRTVDAPPGVPAEYFHERLDEVGLLVASRDGIIFEILEFPSWGMC